MDTSWLSKGAELCWQVGNLVSGVASATRQTALLAVYPFTAPAQPESRDTVAHFWMEGKAACGDELCQQVRRAAYGAVSATRPTALPAVHTFTGQAHARNQRCC